MSMTINVFFCIKPHVLFLSSIVVPRYIFDRRNRFITTSLLLLTHKQGRSESRFRSAPRERLPILSHLSATFHAKRTVQYFSFSFLNIALIDCKACIGSTTSLGFHIERTGIIFASDFLLLSVGSSEVMRHKVLTQTCCMQSNKVLFLS